MVKYRIVVDTGGAPEHIVVAYAYLSRWHWSCAGLVGELLEGNLR
jgi:hypothetical protein